SVTERTREIGIRRAVGARRRQIVGQFLVETLVLSVLGGMLGIGLGISVPWLIEYLAEMPTRVTPWSVMLAVGISGAVGILFGLYPAVRAANVDPIVALRHE
ncbi:MAG: ABC transporter permease, partial [Planctomycetota bacterium]